MKKMRSFNFSSLKFSAATEDEEITEIPKLSYDPVMFENAEEAVNGIEYGKNYMCFFSGRFIFGDFIEALCYKKSLQPEEIYITTLGMNQDNIDSLVNLVDYLGCKKLNLVVSHYFACVERNKLMSYIQQEFKERPVDVAVLQSHAKICLIFSEKGNIAILGSANLSSSSNVEQAIIINDDTTIDFLKKKLDMMMERFTVIHRLDGAKMEWKTGNCGTNAFNALKD